MPSTLAQKLQIKPVWKLLLIHPPQEMTILLVGELKENEVHVAPAAGLEQVKSVEEEMPAEDAVLLFVKDLAETHEFTPQAIRLVKPGGLLWIAYPKGSSKIKTDVNRDKLWDAVLSTGWRPVRQIALDETWSALRFRPQEEVEK